MACSILASYLICWNSQFQEESASDISQKEKSDDPTMDLFPDDDTDERGRESWFVFKICLFTQVNVWCILLYSNVTNTAFSIGSPSQRWLWDSCSTQNSSQSSDSVCISRALWGRSPSLQTSVRGFRENEWSRSSRRGYHVEHSGSCLQVRRCVFQFEFFSLTDFNLGIRTNIKRQQICSMMP